MNVLMKNTIRTLIAKTLENDVQKSNEKSTTRNTIHVQLSFVAIFIRRKRESIVNTEMHSNEWFECNDVNVFQPHIINEWITNLLRWSEMMESIGTQNIILRLLLTHSMSESTPSMCQRLTSHLRMTYATRRFVWLSRACQENVNFHIFFYVLFFLIARFVHSLFWFNLILYFWLCGTLFIVCDCSVSVIIHEAIIALPLSQSWRSSYKTVFFWPLFSLVHSFNFIPSLLISFLTKYFSAKALAL